MYNEKADKKQYELYKKRFNEHRDKDFKKVLPTSFKNFQTLKYDNELAYQELKEMYRYIGRVPEASETDYKLFKEIKSTGVVGSIRVPAKPIDISALTFNDSHASRHGCTLEEATEFVKNAKFSINRSRWDGYSTNYYSFDGAAYVDNECRIKTSFSKEVYDTTTKKIMEIFYDR